MKRSILLLTTVLTFVGCAFFLQSFGGSKADTAAAARHEGDFACHDGFSVSFFLFCAMTPTNLCGVYISSR